MTAGALHIEVQPRYRDVLAHRPSVTVPPLPDELLSSWVARLACHHGLTARECADMMGLGSGMAWARIDVAPPPHVIAALASLSRMPAPRIVDMVLPAEFAGTLVLAARAEATNIQATWVQFCPDCLAQAAYLRWGWRLASTIYCHPHRRMLLDRCPSCQAALAGLSARQVLPLHRCGQCGGDLRTPMARPLIDRRASAVALAVASFLREERIAGLLEQTGLLQVLHKLPNAIFPSRQPALRQMSSAGRIRLYTKTAGVFSRVFSIPACPEAAEERARTVRGMRPLEAECLLLEGETFGPPRHRLRDAPSEHLPRLLQAAAEWLQARELGQQMFARGAPEISNQPAPIDMSLYELLVAYGPVARRRLARRAVTTDPWDAANSGAHQTTP